jgi:hypothetical protein
MGRGRKFPPPRISVALRLSLRRGSKVPARRHCRRPVRDTLHLLRPAERSDPTPPIYLPGIQGPSLTSRPSTGPRHVTPATPSGTVRPHPASLSAWDPRPQPDVTAINRSAARYTCYAQRNGPGSGSSITCPLSLGARNWTCAVNRARPQAVGVGCGDKTGAAAWASPPHPCKIRVESRAPGALG